MHGGEDRCLDKGDIQTPTIRDRRLRVNTGSLAMLLHACNSRFRGGQTAAEALCHLSWRRERVMLTKVT
jgi:hypothetical protein